jgi:hypothetical protein
VPRPFRRIQFFNGTDENVLDLEIEAYNVPSPPANTAPVMVSHQCAIPMFGVLMVHVNELDCGQPPAVQVQCVRVKFNYKVGTMALTPYVAEVSCPPTCTMFAVTCRFEMDTSAAGPLRRPWVTMSAEFDYVAWPGNEAKDEPTDDTQLL